MDKGKTMLTPKQLRNSRICEEYKKLAALHLGKQEDPEFERRRMIKDALIGILAKSGSVTDAHEAWNIFMEKDYTSLPNVFARETGNILDTKVKRFISWFFGTGYRVKESNRNYQFDYHGIQINGVLDLVTECEGKTVLMNLEFGTNPYSDKARTEVNLTGNAVELLCQLMAGEGDAAIAYLTSKDDKTGSLAPGFEEKPGKNMAYLCRPDDVGNALDHAMSLDAKADCASCPMAQLCHTERYEDNEAAESIVRKDATEATEEQKEVLEALDGPMIVLGAPGTGKTYTLVKKVENLLGKGVKGSRVRVMTYTVNATTEFTDRIAAACQKMALPQVSTIHSLAQEIVMEQDGKEVASRLAESTDVRIPLIIDALKNSPVIGGVSYDFPESRFGLFHRLDSIFVQMDKGLDPELALESFKGDKDALLVVYRKYRDAFEAGGYFYYDWLIRRANELLGTPEVAEHYRSLYDYIVVDEFQDTTMDQFSLIKGLVDKRHNITVFGDDDQTIYQFGGASSKVFQTFMESYPECRVEYLEENHRSGKKICDVATGFIAHNESRFGKVLVATRKEGIAPYFDSNYTDDKLIELLKNSSAKPEEVCILARKNSPLESLRLKMEKAGLKATAPRNFLIDTAEFQFLLAFLSYATRGAETDNSTLYRLLTFMGEEAGDGNLLEQAAGNEKLKSADEVYKTGGSMVSVISDIFKTLAGADRNTVAVNQLIKALEDSGVTTAEEILPVMERKLRYFDTTDIGYVKRNGCYNLLTSHKAKGKEWPMVVIYGFDEYGSNEGDDLEAETNLAYVSMTRARDVLVILNRTDKETELQKYLKGTEEIKKEA